MKLTLLKTFGAVGFSFQVEEGGIIAKDGNGNELKEGIDYVLDEKDKPGVQQITQASGLTTYAPPK